MLTANWGLRRPPQLTEKYHTHPGMVNSASFMYITKMTAPKAEKNVFN